MLRKFFMWLSFLCMTFLGTDSCASARLMNVPIDKTLHYRDQTTVNLHCSIGNVELMDTACHVDFRQGERSLRLDLIPSQMHGYTSINQDFFTYGGFEHDDFTLMLGVQCLDSDFPDGPALWNSECFLRYEMTPTGFTLECVQKWTDLNGKSINRCDKPNSADD